MAGSSGISIARNSFEDFKCNANEAIHFKLVRKEDDILDESKVFQPDMTHQIFGDSESIFGYQKLKIEMFFTAARLTACINIKYSDRIIPERCDGVHADDVMRILVDKLELSPANFYTSLDKFRTQIPKEINFRPFGEMIHSYTTEKAGETRQFEIYKTKIEAPGFRDFHERLQVFLMFYVDAASYIDVDDERWDYYLLFEKYSCDGNKMYAVAGYMTVYNYYAYPEKVRPRISQVLVLPPFQRMGHCAMLIQTFYNQITPDKNVRDITVEDPSEGFQRVRDYVDCCNCMKLDAFKPEKLHKGFSDEMVRTAREKLKINKKQARRVYEILRLKVTDVSQREAFKQYRLDVKKRLNLPFQKTGRDFEKLRRTLDPTELAAAMNNYTLEQRLQYLNKAFEDTTNEYSRIVERMARS